MITNCISRGVHPPWDHDAFPPVSDFSPIFEKCSDSEKNSQNFTFTWEISWFSSAKISDDLFLVIDHKFRFSPYFRCFSTFPPCFAKINISSLLWKMFPPLLHKFTCFLHTLRVFRFPPTFTMMHLCITQCTYWTPLPAVPHSCSVGAAVHAIQPKSRSSGGPHLMRRYWWLVRGLISGEGADGWWGGSLYRWRA